MCPGTGPPDLTGCHPCARTWVLPMYPDRTARPAPIGTGPTPRAERAPGSPPQPPTPYRPPRNLSTSPLLLCACSAFSTAIRNALRDPTSTTSLRALVIAVYSKFRCSIR